MEHVLHKLNIKDAIHLTAPLTQIIPEAQTQEYINLLFNK
jgi:hypothetical protein